MNDPKLPFISYPSPLGFDYWVCRDPIRVERAKKIWRDHGLSVRVWRALGVLGLLTWDEVVEFGEARLLRQPNFGAKSLRELVEKLGPLGMQFPLPENSTERQAQAAQFLRSLGWTCTPPHE